MKPILFTNIPSPMDDDMSATSLSLTDIGICEFNIKQEPMENRIIPPPRKRQRLDHLTEEEKTLRRKIKNRVAAQSARDRKKALLENLEDDNKILQSEIKTINRKNEELAKRNEELMKENEELRKRLEAQDNLSHTNASCEGCRKKESLGHASSINVSLPQRQDSQTLIILLMMPCIGLMILYLMSSLKAYRNLMMKSKFLTTECIVPSFKKNYQMTQWWGPHQKSWNPSKNL